MADWIGRIRNHQVWAEMESLGPVIGGAVAIPEQEPDARAGLERIRTALAFIGKRLASADPAVVSVASLDRLRQMTSLY